MLRRLRRRRALWAALAVGLVAVPAVLGGSTAFSADGSELLTLPERNPLETVPPDPVTMEAALVLAQSNQIADLTPEVYRSLIVAAANRQQVDPRLVAAIITVETHWNGELVGQHGEKGLMQILPETGAYLAKQAGLIQVDLADPATNVALGVLYISDLLREYGNSVQQALAAYNGGPRAVETAATNLYARKVLKVYETVPDRALLTTSPEIRPQAS